MAGAWLLTVFATFGALLPIVNPFSTAAAFLALTARYSEEDRNRLATRVGFSMLGPQADAATAPADGRAGSPQIAFTPLAMPLLSGPGSIAVTISLAAGAESLWEDVAVAVGIALVLLVSCLVLGAERAVNRYLGETGIDALTRIMGLLLVCIGVQFVASAVVDFVASERALETLQRILEHTRAGA